MAPRSSKNPFPALAYRVFVSVVTWVMNRSSSPSASKSPRSTPMLASLAPPPFTATPLSSARSVNVPSRPLIHNWLGRPSLAT